MTVSPLFLSLHPLSPGLQEANPDMGTAKVHKAVKEAQPTWQVSEDRVKKAIAEVSFFLSPSIYGLL